MDKLEARVACLRIAAEQCGPGNDDKLCALAERLIELVDESPPRVEHAVVATLPGGPARRSIPGDPVKRPPPGDVSTSPGSKTAKDRRRGRPGALSPGMTATLAVVGDLDQGDGVRKAAIVAALPGTPEQATVANWLRNLKKAGRLQTHGRARAARWRAPPEIPMPKGRSGTARKAPGEAGVQPAAPLAPAEYNTSPRAAIPPLPPRKPPTVGQHEAAQRARDWLHSQAYPVKLIAGLWHCDGLAAPFTATGLVKWANGKRARKGLAPIEARP